MTVGISSIKNEAKNALKGKWVSSIIASLVFLFSILIIINIGWALSLVVGDIASYVIVFVLCVILCGPLAIGLIRYFRRMYGGMDETPAASFYYFSTKTAFLKSLKFCVLLAIRLVVFAVIYHLPAILLYIISNPELYEFLKAPIPMWSQHLKPLTDFLTTIGTVLTAFSLSKFYLAPFLVVVDDGMDVEEALHMSTVISKHTVMDFVFLLFSLILWLVISVLYIPLLFTLPYFIMCYIAHSLYAVNDYNEQIKKINDDNLPSFVAGI